MNSTYVERPHRFGPSDGLFGILCRGSGMERPEMPIVVMVNAGLVHRVGPNRTYVYLARAFASVGIPSFRFDLSGIGDSDRRDGVLSLSEAVSEDIAEVLSFLKEAEPERAVVLLGICSGAFDAIEHGLANPRITGIVAIDPQGSFRNRRHGVFHYMKRFTRARSWRNALRNPAMALRNAGARILDVNGDEPADPSDAVPTEAGGVRPRYSRSSLGEKLDAIIDSDARALFVFTDGLEDNYAYRGQFEDCYPVQCTHPNIVHEFLPGSDHTLRRHSDRDALVELVSDWITTNRFPWAERSSLRRAPPARSQFAPGSGRT